ncbi:phosphatidylinositol 4-phosphate 5-kinase (macronuclear) [Tetrahymena thermophila SB210]|uniref:Phosphatidylinositol 4-phosphate 5-kinase n=1 Tax=Tetrahymena thermophila (strain SB210) TaxID=312017 RepID=A4VF03_TETTS|nr:phosphatidylinositol 4-phosphate 5-kinase [Tetrahymena thermophila SB210]EDK31269.2 phosphatidylinositol 4-phosphate 5-kinase [Tetrahymena thermophila SB210]|eukprot:XP_001470685.2 phosphatidylinositol 4-phosphate 5-kinase [Tetrahymena thermophila SB210]
MFCCGDKNRKKNLLPQKREIQILLESTLFTEKELRELKQQFMEMSKNTGYLTMMQFRDCMGILGLENVQFLSDRIFNIMADPNGHIYFQNFIIYLNTIMNGDENEKMKMSFRLIDDKNKGYFIKEDLQMMIKSIVNSWAAITQTTLTKEMLSKVDKQINHIFKVMDIKKQEKVEEQDFCLSLQKYPDLLEIFDFLNKGVTDTVVHNDNRSRELQIAKELAHIEKFLESLTLYLTGETTQFYEINLINQDHIHQKIDFCKKEVNNRVPSFQEIQKKLYPFSSQQNENIQNGEESINLNFEKGIDVSNQTYHQSNFILHNQKQSINSDKHQLKFVNKQKSNDNNNIQIKNDHLKNVSNSISMDIKNKQNENMHYLQTEQDQLQHHSKNPSNLSECGSGEKDQFDDHFYNFNMIDMHKNIQQQFEEENNINKNKNIYYQEGFDSPQKSQKNSQESNNNSQQNATFQPIIKNENSLSHQEQIQTAQQSSSHRINQQQQRSSSVMNGDSAHKQNILFQSPTLGIISGEGQKNNYINIHKRNFSSQSNSDNDFQTAQFVSSLPNQQYLLQNLQSSKHPDYVIEGSFQESTTIYPNKNNNNFDQNLKNLSVSNTSIQQFQNKVGASFQMPLKDRSQNLDYPQKLRQYQFVNKGNSISTTDQQTNNFNSIGQLNNFSFMHNHPQSQNTSQTHSQQTLQSPILNYDEEAILKKYESVMCADCICRVTQKFKHDKLKEFRKLSVPVVQQKVQMNQQQQINQNYHSIKQIQYLQSKTFPHTSTNSQISFNENNYFLDPSNHQLRTKLDRIAQKFLGDIDEIESCNLGSDDDEYKKKNNQRQQPQTPMQNPFQVMDPVSINPKRGDSGLFTSGISNKEIQKGQAIKYNQNMKYQYSSSSNANEIIPIDSQIKAKEYEQNVIASVQKQQADDLTNRIIRFDDTDYSRLNSPNQQLSPSISNLASFYEQKAETYIPGSKKSSIYIQQGNNTKPTINTASSTQRQNSIQGYSLKFPNNHKNYTKSSTAEIVRQTSQSVGNAIDNKMHQQIKKTNDTNVILKQRQQNESPILQTEDIQIEVSANAQRVGNKFIQSEVNIKEVCSNQQLNDQNVNNNNIYSGTNNDINTNQIIDPTHYVYVESYNTNSKNVQSSSSQIKTKNSNQLISHPVQSSSYNNRRIINASNLKSQRDMIETESENIQYNAHTPTTFLNKIEQEQMTSSLSNEVNKLQFGSKNQIDKTPTAVMISKDNIFLHIQNQKNNDTQNENQEEYLGSSDNLLEQQKIEYPIKLSQLQDKKIKKLIQERKQDFKYQEDAVYMNPNNNIPKISQMLLQSGNQEKASQYLYANQTDKNNSQTPTKIELNGFNRKEDHNIDTGHNMKYKEENADDLINKLNYISPRHNIYSASKLNKNSYNPQSLRSSQPIDIFKVQSTILNTSKANNLFQNNLHNIQSQENKQTDHSQVNFIQQIMEMNADELKKRAVNIFFYAKEICLFVQTIKKSIESNLNARLSEKQSSNIYIGQGRQKSLDNKLQSFSKLQAAASPLHSKQPMVAQSMQGRLPHQLNQSVIINNKTPPLQPIFNNNNEEENIRISTIYNIQKKQPRQKEPRKPKLMVFFGHQNWNLVVNMMMGIQMSVQSAASNIILNENNQMPDLQNRDFKVKYLFELLPRKDNLEKEWSYKVCKFQDYAPNVFQRIRMLYNITDEQYLKSLGPNQLFNLGNGGLNSFSQLTSTGKSGSFFYFTADGLFTLKTVSRTEFHHLKNILKNYYEHLKENRNSLIIKFFGLHKIKIRMKKSTKVEIVYIVIMANVFHTTKLIHERYDLKGSTYGRTTKNSRCNYERLGFLGKKNQNISKI